MQPMTCKNCLAPINPHLDHCEYCGGYFERPVYYIKPGENLYNEALKALKNYNGIVTVAAEDVQIMTPNELRSNYGLDPFTDKIIPLELNCEYTFDECKQQYVIKKPLKPKKKLFGFGR